MDGHEDDSDEEDQDDDRESDDDDDDDEEEEDEEENGDQDDGQVEEGQERRRSKKRKKPQKEPKRSDRDLADRAIKRIRANERRKKLQEEEEMIQEYYQAGTYYGMSAANMVYNMASQLGRSSNDFLWYMVDEKLNLRFSLIGLTDQYVNHRIDNEKYMLHADALKQEVSRFNISTASRPEVDILDTESLFGEELLNPSRSKNSASKVRGADDHSIVCEEDFRLMLLRHWSLSESMYHSSYVAARLGIWREKGRRRLTNLLVKMGYVFLGNPCLSVKVSQKGMPATLQRNDSCI